MGTFEKTDRPDGAIIAWVNNRVRTPLAPYPRARELYEEARKRFIDGDDGALIEMADYVEPETDYDDAYTGEAAPVYVPPKPKLSAMERADWAITHVHPLIWLVLVAVLFPVLMFFVPTMVTFILFGGQALALYCGLRATKLLNGAR